MSTSRSPDQAQERVSGPPSSPVEIPSPRVSKETTWHSKTLLFGSAPPKALTRSEGCTNTSLSTSTSFTSWDDPRRGSAISDVDLYLGKSVTDIEPILKDAPAEPGPQLPVMPLLEKRSKGNVSRQRHLNMQHKLARTVLPQVSEDMEKDYDEQ
jgi:hypothetical protein